MVNILTNQGAWLQSTQGCFCRCPSFALWLVNFKKTPTTCVCGASFAVDHLLSCQRGGYPSLRHNEIRDLTGTLLTEVCSDVKVEPE